MLEYDPMPPLLGSGNEAVVYFTQRDLLGAKVSPVQALWRTAPVLKLLRRQQANGSWRYPGGNHSIRSAQNYDQLETYRLLGYLVEMYGMDKRHPAMRNAAEFMFGCQTDDGDFRGIYGNQYTPNYSAGIMELLIKAGYARDPRIKRGFEWLLAIRQDDGGWAIPLRTVGMKLDAIAMERKPFEPDRAKPFSHLATGCVLRAFAAHPGYRRTNDALKSGELLAGRLFARDAYPDRGTPEYWTRFTFPFWFTDLASALDSLSLLGFAPDDARIRRALGWFADSQQKDGTWNLKLLKGKHMEVALWMHLAICRVFGRFHAADKFPRSG